MNNPRRKRIDRVHELLEEQLEELNALRDEEEEAYDNLPESLQETERGEAMQEAIDNLDSAVSSIEEAIEALEAATQ